MAPPKLSASPNAPEAPALAPPQRALWQRAAGAIVIALTPSNQPASARLSPEALDKRLTLHVNLNDTGAFDALLLEALALRSALPPLPEALAAASRSDKLYYLGRLIEAGISPNASLASFSLAPTFPLHLAASRGSCEALRLLLSRGADPSLLNPEGHSALWLACKAACPHSAEILINAGAPLDAQDYQGADALSFCSPNRREDPLLSGSTSELAFGAQIAFSRALLPKAKIARALLRAGALVRDPHPLLALAARLRDQRLMDELASRGFFIQELLGAPSAPHLASAWRAYALGAARRDPLIADFIEQAQAEGAAALPESAPLSSSPGPSEPSPPQPPEPPSPEPLDPPPPSSSATLAKPPSRRILSGPVSPP